MSVTLRLGTSEDDLVRAAAILRAGGLVAIPTETVYGLAVRADDSAAVERLFAAKDRPTDNPLIVHVADVDGVLTVARALTPLAQDLLERFAPGPLTVVLPARDDLPAAVTAGLDTVAVRIPDHPVTLALLRLAGVPLAAPSANRSGRPSPTRAEHVLEDLDGRIDAVVDAGPTRVGLESTVVDARGAAPIVLREGEVTREALAALGIDLGSDPTRVGDARVEDRAKDAAEDAAHRSPGTRHRHYASTVPVHIAAPGTGPSTALALVRTLTRPRASSAVEARDGARIGLVAVRASGAVGAAEGTMTPDTGQGSVVLLGAPRDAAALATGLFAWFREAESRGLDAVVVEAVAEEGIGRAVMDRLRRAAEASGR